MSINERYITSKEIKYSSKDVLTHISTIYKYMLFSKTKQKLGENFLLNLQKILLSGNNKLLKFFISYMVDWKCKDIENEVERNQLEHMYYIVQCYSPFEEEGVETTPIGSAFEMLNEGELEEEIIDTLINSFFHYKGGIIDTSIKEVLEDKIKKMYEGNEEEISQGIYKLEEQLVFLEDIMDIEEEIPFNTTLMEDMREDMIQIYQSKKNISLSVYYKEYLKNNNREYSVSDYDIYSEDFLNYVSLTELSKMFFEQSQQSSDKYNDFLVETLPKYTYIKVVEELNDLAFNHVNSKLQSIMNEFELIERGKKTTDDRKKRLLIDKNRFLELRQLFETPQN